MKIEIDLNDILGDECGAETLQDSVRRQVTSALAETLTTQIKDRVDDEVHKVLQETLAKAVNEQIPGIMAELLDAEYRCVDRYGDRAGTTTTFRKQLIETLRTEMTYKRTSDYERSKSTFTKAVDAVVEENMKEFKKDFNKLVTDQFTKDAFEHAVTELRKRMGISA